MRRELLREPIVLLLLGKSGLYGNVIRLAPSMLIDKSEVDEGARRLDLALADVR